MKWAIALTLLFACSPVAAGVAVDVCRSPGAVKTLANVSTPGRGSPERKAMLEVLRRFVKRMSDLDVIFVISHLKSDCGWAWIEADPQSADGTQRYEPISALLALRSGRWEYVESPPEWPECETDPDCVDRSRYFRKLAARHPGLPPAIFPSTRRATSGSRTSGTRERENSENFRARKPASVAWRFVGAA